MEKNSVRYYPNHQIVKVTFTLYKDNLLPPIELSLKTVTNDNKISATLRYIADVISDME